MKIMLKDVTRYNGYEYTAEASEIGIAPCEAPIQILTTLGNKQPLFLRKIAPDGTLFYSQRFGCVTLLVFND